MEAGIIFRASGRMWQDRPHYSIEREGAEAYLAARDGVIETNLISKMSEICHGYHLVTLSIKMDKTGEDYTDYICDCKGFAGQVECSHIIASQALEDELSIDELTAKIIPGRRGRREKNTDPTPKLSDVDQEVRGPLSVRNAEAQYGEKVAFLDVDTDDILFGRVTSNLHESTTLSLF